MFEVGFSELLVIFVLALLVLGPEKLPRLASQVGRWIGRARAMAKQFRDQLEEEVNVAEANKWKPSPQPDPTPSTPPASETESTAAPADDPHTIHDPHHSGPPPEPEASVYEPPAYASAPSATPPDEAPAEKTNGTHAEPHTPSQSPAASDESPLRPGDVVTTTHERGI
jgi:sec-independent protein translocase protein TatB